MPKFKWTNHAKWRSASRAISGRAIEYALKYGQCFWAGRGCRAYFLGRRAVRKVREELDVRLERFTNIAVIIAEDGAVVTVEHCPKPPRHWKPR
jgi:hypothetical protein